MVSKSALVTGGAKGIGRDVVRVLAQRGFRVTIADTDAEAGREASQEARELGAPDSHFEAVDVTDFASLSRTFEGHARRFGGLDVVVVNAGVGGGASKGDWQKSGRTVIQVNLTAQIESIMLAKKHMKPGSVIAVVASSGAVYPMPVAPSYAASKAGALMFVRSIAPLLEKAKIKIFAFCPAYTKTDLVLRGMREDKVFRDHVMALTKGVLMSPASVARTLYQATLDPTLHGQALVVLPSKTGSAEVHDLYTASHSRLMPYYEPQLYSSRTRKESAFGPLPKTYKKLVVTKLSDKFREATAVVEAPLPLHLKEGQVLLKRLHVGVNASDVNFSAGRYYGVKAAEKMLPFGAGFESLSLVVGRGEGVDLALGSPVLTTEYGAFSEFGLAKAKRVIPVPEADRAYIAFLTSGLTASIALDVEGGLRSSKVKTVLVTAAAGGTGQFAVQLAKLAGKHVIATCGSREKAALLKRLGADRVVLYKSESLGEVLRREYKKGVDLVYDGVGGKMFEAAVANLSVGGKILVIGMIGAYTKGWPRSKHEGVNELLLWKSASVRGFFLLHYTRSFPQHLNRLIYLYKRGLLQVEVDDKPFVGVDSIVGAVEHLHSGKSKGKVIVAMEGPSSKL